MYTSNKSRERIVFNSKWLQNQPDLLVATVRSNSNDSGHFGPVWSYFKIKYFYHKCSRSIGVATEETIYILHCIGVFLHLFVAVDFLEKVDAQYYSLFYWSSSCQSPRKKFCSCQMKACKKCVKCFEFSCSEILRFARKVRCKKKWNCGENIPPYVLTHLPFLPTWSEVRRRTSSGRHSDALRFTRAFLLDVAYVRTSGAAI